MTNTYYETISKLEQQNTARDYILGWASGYLGNPKIEEQRITDSWEAGYEDGQDKNTDNAEKWKN
ncbi:MAG: Alvin_2107 family globule sulfur oxidation protein [bacterium]